MPFPRRKGSLMDYWIEILQRYLSYSVVRYVLAAIGAMLFIIVILILDRTRRRFRLKRLAARIRTEKQTNH